MKKLVLAISVCILLSAFIFAGCDSTDRGKVSDTSQGITTTKHSTTASVRTTAPTGGGGDENTSTGGGENTSIGGGENTSVGGGGDENTSVGGGENTSVGGGAGGAGTD